MSAATAETQTWTAPPPDSRRWTALAFIAIAQLMIALDATIVSIALPSAQSALGASDADRQWVVTAYALAFGGLLLLGGKVADYAGRKRAFLIGLAGFAVASAIGGAAPNFATLVAARALQGAFAALLAPTALSLLAVSFTQPRERATAFAVYGSIAGSGAAIGLLLGGALTQYLAWRWCLYVNIPIAVMAGIGGWLVLPAGSGRAKAALDLPGVVLAAGGMVALVYSSTAGIGLLAVGGLLLALFVFREARTANPLLPLRILTDRNRGGSYITVAMAIAGMFGAFLFLTYYLQVVLQFTPLQAGLAFLPMTIASQAGSWLIASRLMPYVAPRALMAPGAAVAAAGMALLTQLHADSAYLTLVLPAEVLLGLGISCVMVPAFSTATHGIDPREAGVASATVNTAQQIGGSLGTALLNSIAISATAAYAGPRAAALVHGFSVATGWGVVILLVGAIAAAVLINTGRPAPHRV
ncbi:MAG: MFS transporter [Chloroflexi bacterium]|nr:MAG: MFS transporter [Chloroflexota bacterium]